MNAITTPIAPAITSNGIVTDRKQNECALKATRAYEAVEISEVIRVVEVCLRVASVCH